MRRPTSPGSTWAAKKTITLSTNSVTRPSAKRFRMKRAIVGLFPRGSPAARYAFVPAWTTSTWPMAETLTPAIVFLVAVR